MGMTMDTFGKRLSKLNETKRDATYVENLSKLFKEVGMKVAASRLERIYHRLLRGA